MANRFVVKWLDFGRQLQTILPKIHFHCNLENVPLMSKKYIFGQHNITKYVTILGNDGFPFEPLTK